MKVFFRVKITVRDEAGRGRAINPFPAANAILNINITVMVFVTTLRGGQGVVTVHAGMNIVALDFVNPRRDVWRNGLKPRKHFLPFGLRQETIRIRHGYMPVNHPPIIAEKTEGEKSKMRELDSHEGTKVLAHAFIKHG